MSERTICWIHRNYKMIALHSISSRDTDAAICNNIIETVQRYRQSPRILHSDLVYLITSLRRHADHHVPVVPVFLHYNHTNLRMRQGLWV
jgi:hypothetical protein